MKSAIQELSTSYTGSTRRMPQGLDQSWKPRGVAVAWQTEGTEPEGSQAVETSEKCCFALKDETLAQLKPTASLACPQNCTQSACKARVSKAQVQLGKQETLKIFGSRVNSELVVELEGGKN